jgi:hypothetical protein
MCNDGCAQLLPAAQQRSQRTYVGDEGADVGNHVSHRQLHDRLARRNRNSLWPGVAGDRLEGLRSAKVVGCGMTGTAVERRQFDLAGVCGEEPLGADGEDVVGTDAVRRRMAEACQTVFTQPEEDPSRGQPHRPGVGSFNDRVWGEFSDPQQDHDP